MNNQYTFTQEDMQRLTAIVHIDDERRVPEQVMNMLESLLAKPVGTVNIKQREPDIVQERTHCPVCNPYTPPVKDDDLPF